jgi:DUF1365 family protein
MTLRSAIYVGSVMHRRLQPLFHRFRYRAFWLLLELDELDILDAQLRWFSYNRPNVFSLYDKDHGDGSPTPLRVQAEDKLREARIDISGGSIRLLCMPRTLGYCFNPLSIYFCYRSDGSPAAVIYQVHNTFGERHHYVIPVVAEGGEQHQTCRKALYVSPFMNMNMRYDFRVSGTVSHLAVGIRVRAPEGPVLNAVLTGKKRALSDRNLMLAFFSMPAITVKVIAAIHWEALRLWLKGLRLIPRPAPPIQPTTIVVTGNAVRNEQ